MSWLTGWPFSPAPVVDEPDPRSQAVEVRSLGRAGDPRERPEGGDAHGRLVGRLATAAAPHTARCGPTRSRAGGPGRAACGGRTRRATVESTGTCVPRRGDVR